MKTQRSQAEAYSQLESDNKNYQMQLFAKRYQLDDSLIPRLHQYIRIFKDGSIYIETEGLHEFFADFSIFVEEFFKGDPISHYYRSFIEYFLNTYPQWAPALFRKITDYIFDDE